MGTVTEAGAEVTVPTLLESVARTVEVAEDVVGVVVPIVRPTGTNSTGNPPGPAPIAANPPSAGGPGGGGGGGGPTKPGSTAKNVTPLITMLVGGSISMTPPLAVRFDAVALIAPAP